MAKFVVKYTTSHSSLAAVRADSLSVSEGGSVEFFQKGRGIVGAVLLQPGMMVCDADHLLGYAAKASDRPTLEDLQMENEAADKR